MAFSWKLQQLRAERKLKIQIIELKKHGSLINAKRKERRLEILRERIQNG